MQSLCVLIFRIFFVFQVEVFISNLIDVLDGGGGVMWEFSLKGLFVNFKLLVFFVFL